MQTADHERVGHYNGLIEDYLVSTPDGVPEELFLRDDYWVRQSAVMPTRVMEGNPTPVSMFDERDLANATFSSASLKFTNTSLGGNFHINPPPSYTPYADVPDTGIRYNSQEMTLGYLNGDVGMGPFYSESIDDRSQIIHLQFGVAQYNSLTQFFMSFYNSDMGTMARTGRLTDNVLTKFMSFAGDVVGFVIAPLLVIPVAISFLGTAARYFMNYPISKFFNLKPAMELYWNAVTQLVNQFAVNLGVVNYFEEKQKTQIIGEVTTPDTSILQKFLPDIFSKNGTIDVYAMANQAKRMQMAHEKKFLQLIENSSGDNFEAEVRGFLGDVGKLKKNARTVAGRTLEGFLSDYANMPDLSRITADRKDGSIERDFKTPSEENNDQTVADVLESGKYDPVADKEKFINYAIANYADGSDWVSFRVDYTGSVQESFSNQTAPSALAQRLNSASAAARDISNTLSGGVIGEAVNAVMSFAKSVASKANLDGLFSLGAFVDIPEHWDASSAQFNKSTYTMTLGTAYGNPISQLFSIYVPLAMLLAGALPLATGRQSYTSPFLCQLYDKGRCITRCGIIENLSITRGTSNLGFDKEGRAMQIEVSFSVKDLSTIMAVPIQPGFSLNLKEALVDSENAFQDYLRAMSAVDFRDVIYRVPMLKMIAKKKIADADTFFSAAHFAQYMTSMPGSNLIKAVMAGAIR